MTEKRCGSCREWLPLSAFHAGTGADGRQWECKECQARRVRQRRELAFEPMGQRFRPRGSAGPGDTVDPRLGAALARLRESEQVTDE